MKKIAIAIDGPAAAGKSTVAKIVASKLNYTYIDTGAMYRAVTLYVLHNNIDIDDEEMVVAVLPNITIEFTNKNGRQHVLLNSQDITTHIRSAEVTKHVSKIASYAKLRKEMVKRQQQFVSERGVVMDGRDIGTHVIPDAEVKFFLTASVEIRAKRRYMENKRRGFESDINQIEEEIRKRDLQDMERDVSPLVKASDAIEFDTTTYTIQEVADHILKRVYQVTQAQ